MINLSFSSGIPASLDTALRDVGQYIDSLYKSQGGFLFPASGYIVVKERCGCFPVYLYCNYPKFMKNIKHIARYGHAAEGISKRI